MPNLTTYDYDIFLSHNHADQEWTTKLAERLEQEDWQGRKLKVFFSPWDIRPGQSIPKEIEKALAKSRKVGLIMSPDAMDSAWVELERLVTTYIDISARDERLIPLYRHTCEIPALLRPVLYVDFRTDADFEEGYQTLLSVIKDEPLPRGAPIRPDPQATLPSAIPRPPVVGFVARSDRDGRNLLDWLREELLPQKAQLVALWGAGGVGKTTLAAEAVRSLTETSGQRLVWITADGRANFTFSTLLDDISEQLGRTDLRPLAAGPKEEALLPLIAVAATLIVLDNLETISPEEELLCKEFLAQRVRCSVLITTRERIDGAHLIPLVALSPDEANEFLNRLISQTQDSNIYEKVDRDRILKTAEFNPLIIQWIVAQIDLAQDPEDVLSDLAHGEGDAAERVFDRSFNLPQMAEGGRAVLLALSLFMPSATRPMLAEVAGMGKDKDKKKFKKAQKTLASLWLLKQTDGGKRLAVEGLTRELAKTRLSHDPRSKTFRQRYVARFLRHAEANSEVIPAHLNSLEAERDNLLNAMDMAFEIHDWDGVMDLMRAIAFPGMLNTRGYWDDAIRKGEQAMAAAVSAGDAAAVAEFAGNAAIVREERGEYSEARKAYQKALNAFKKLGSDFNVATALMQLGILSYKQGGIEEARRLYNESLEIWKKLGDQSGIATALHHFGVLAHNQGDLEEARRFYSDSLEIRKKLPNQSGIASTLHQFGRLAQDQGDLEGERRLYNESQKVWEKLGDKRSIAGASHNLAALAQAQGEIEEARRLYNESLEINKKLGDQSGIASSLHQLGSLAEDEGNNVEAAQLFGEALAIFEKLKSPNAKIVRRNLERVEGKSS